MECNYEQQKRTLMQFSEEVIEFMTKANTDLLLYLSLVPPLRLGVGLLFTSRSTNALICLYNHSASPFSLPLSLPDQSIYPQSVVNKGAAPPLPSVPSPE